MRSWPVGLAVGALVLGLTGASAAQEQVLALDVDKKAMLGANGQFAVVRVTASCPVGAELLESFVYVNQDGNSTEWGGVGVPCDGESHTVLVQVEPLDWTLRKGRASASGYLLLTSGESISPVARLTLKEWRHFG